MECTEKCAPMHNFLCRWEPVMRIKDEGRMTDDGRQMKRAEGGLQRADDGRDKSLEGEMS